MGALAAPTAENSERDSNELNELAADMLSRGPERGVGRVYSKLDEMEEKYKREAEVGQARDLDEQPGHDSDQLRNLTETSEIDWKAQHQEQCRDQYHDAHYDWYGNASSWSLDHWNKENWVAQCHWSNERSGESSSSYKRAAGSYHGYEDESPSVKKSRYDNDQGRTW